MSCIAVQIQMKVFIETNSLACEWNWMISENRCLSLRPSAIVSIWSMETTNAFKSDMHCLMSEAKLSKNKDNRMKNDQRQATKKPTMLAQ